MLQQRNQSQIHIPRLPNGAFAPVSVTKIEIEKQENGACALRIVLRRDLSVPLKEFSLSFRLSPLPLHEDDSFHPFRTKRFASERINDRQTLVLKLSLPPKNELSGCCVFVSEITLADGQVITYNPTDFYTDVGDEAEYFPEQEEQTSANLFSGVANYLIAGIAVVCALAVLCFTGSYFLQKNAVKVTDSLLSEGRYNEAYKIAYDSCKDSVLQEVCNRATEHYLSVEDYFNAFVYAKAAPEPFEKRVVETISTILINQNRTDELRQFFENNAYDTLFQKVCERAADTFLAQKDYHSAYLYAEIAPEPFCDRITQAAISGAITETDGVSVSENAMKVIRKLENNPEFDQVISDLSTRCKELNAFGQALTLATEFRSSEERKKIASNLFVDGMKYFIAEARYEDAMDLIGNYGYDAEAADEILSYCEDTVDLQAFIDHYIQAGDNASAIILSNYLGADSSAIRVTADDPSVREKLGAVYSLLTAEQKRSYHAQTFALCKEAYCIQDGAIAGTDFTTAVSVDASEHQAVVLCENGTVAALSGDGHYLVTDIAPKGTPVQISVGFAHVVVLNDDGTVEAFGNNDKGQCNTQNWAGIVAVAAGADFTLGLTENGTLVACGSNLSGQCDVSGYRNVADIDACNQSAILLFTDRTMAVQGNRSMGLTALNQFTDVIRFSAGSNCVVAQTADGKYLLAEGTVTGSCGSTDGWAEVAQFAAGSLCTGYRNHAGEVILSGDGIPKS